MYAELLFGEGRSGGDIARGYQNHARLATSTADVAPPAYTFNATYLTTLCCLPRLVRGGMQMRERGTFVDLINKAESSDTSGLTVHSAPADLHRFGTRNRRFNLIVPTLGPPNDCAAIARSEGR
ncbi:unnamed protein product, partial [Iphiclides podalirius]